ncbi:MAG TPA: flagellar export chaperone FliS [Steroidobacteraceae bacterium]
MSVYSRTANMAAYQSNAVHGGVAAADSHGLVLMLMTAAVERMTAARGCIEHGETARKAKLLHSSVKIIGELRGILNLSEGGSLAQNLSDLYDYMTRRLLLANVESNVACISEVLNLLVEVRSAWIAIGPQTRQTAPRALAVP